MQMEDEETTKPVVEQIAEIAQGVHATLRDCFELLMLKAKLYTQDLRYVAILAIFSFVFLLSIWFSLNIELIIGLSYLGYALPVVIAVIGGVNVLMLGLCLLLLKLHFRPAEQVSTALMEDKE